MLQNFAPFLFFIFCFFTFYGPILDLEVCYLMLRDVVTLTFRDLLSPEREISGVLFSRTVTSEKELSGT